MAPLYTYPRAIPGAGGQQHCPVRLSKAFNGRMEGSIVDEPPARKTIHRRNGMRFILALLLVGMPISPQTPAPKKVTVPPAKVQPATPGQGPFGLEAGMTLAQVKALVGNLTLKGDNIYRTATVPHPYALFETYSLIIDPELGLQKISAVSVDISCNSFGDQLKDKFSILKESLMKVYGDGKHFNYLKAGSIWHENNEWMMGILKKERNLISFWDKENATMKHNISGITLEANAINMSTGYILLSYQFDRFEDVLEKHKAATDNAL